MRPTCPFALTLFALLGAGACGQKNSSGAGADAPSYPASAPTGPCGAVVQQQAIEGWNHVAVCSVVDYGTNPPSSGNHYPIWAAYKNYTTAVPEGFWVHDLEHGAVVLSYNCPNGCDSAVAAAAQMLAGLPQDPACVSLGEGVARRSVMTPDPKLDVAFAASAWGWTLRANCFDPVAFQAFALAHYNQGREPAIGCEDGEDPTGNYPANCGDGDE